MTSSDQPSLQPSPTIKLRTTLFRFYDGTGFLNHDGDTVLLGSSVFYALCAFVVSAIESFQGSDFFIIRA